MKPHAKFSTAHNLRPCSLIVKTRLHQLPLNECESALSLSDSDQSLAPVGNIAVVSKRVTSEARVCLAPPWLVHPDGQPRGSNSILVQCRPLPPPHAGQRPAIVHLHLCVGLSFVTTSQPNVHLLTSRLLKPRPEADRVTAAGGTEKEKESLVY